MAHGPCGRVAKTASGRPGLSASRPASRWSKAGLGRVPRGLADPTMGLTMGATSAAPSGNSASRAKD
ncbi:hypothetical protein E4U42_001680 [Claviceps africana]|uniref:Uncharacterized protein n=1 Tax=Claviceps africana TaxID=83212 RepID=A0A8K0NF52_9HYPO|nr:hypothetical protein E4U42_001680 [Claviceps africana]